MEYNKNEFRKNLELENNINEFISYCRFQKNLDFKTLKAYSIDLRQYNKFVAFNNNSRNFLEKECIKEYLVVLNQFKPKTIKRKIASLKTFYSFMEFDDIIDFNPLRKMKIQITENKVLPSILSEVEVTKVIDYVHSLKNMGSTYLQKYILSRNVILFELLFITGARVSEICNLKITSININSSEILIFGKGRRERVIHFCNEEILKLITEYISKYNSLIIDSGGYLFVNRMGNGISSNSVRSVVNSIGVSVGLNKPITPHIFRHTLASLLLENDVDIKYIQSILGHSSISTTQIYTHVNLKRRRQIIEQRHPRNSIILNKR